MASTNKRRRRKMISKLLLERALLFILVALCLPALSAYAEGGRADVPFYTWIALGTLFVWAFRAFCAHFESNQLAYRREQEAWVRDTERALEEAEQRRHDSLILRGIIISRDELRSFDEEWKAKEEALW